MWQSPYHQLSFFSTVPIDILSYAIWRLGAEYKPPVVVNSAEMSGPLVSRGMFSAPAAEPRLCGFVRPRTMNDEVTPLSVLEKIMIQKLTPEHRKGNNPFKKGSPKVPLPAPTKVSDLWAEKPTLSCACAAPGTLQLPMPCLDLHTWPEVLYVRRPFGSKGSYSFVKIVQLVKFSESKETRKSPTLCFHWTCIEI